MVGYNLTQIGENATGLLGFTQGVNDVLMFGWLGTLFLIGFCVVIFMAFTFSTQDAKRSMAATTYISFIMALLLRAVDLVPSLVLYITIVATAATLAFTFKKD